MGLANPIHIAFVVVILMLLFGARRLPEIGRSLGGGIKELKSSLDGHHDAPAPRVEKPASAPDAL